MVTITAYSVEFIKDPFGILTGERYEFILDLEVDEDDELYSEKGLYVKVIYRVDESTSEIVKYDIYERTTERYLEFDFEEEELEAIAAFCKEHWQGAKL
ncbi:DUF6509 family protein [Paenibacillus abyssi]|uniref:Pullulanase n=1 Tax=Paenibacillus abyssi TaxID=1340531 RepID=A0A917D2A9_9BACL|nr:DUF6509 family protein [Paenibacillus abyssi]GGG08784.1 hypothetical protein GCM10010916_27030 [Paenibacillus abyssi]